MHAPHLHRRSPLPRVALAAVAVWLVGCPPSGPAPGPTPEPPAATAEVTVGDASAKPLASDGGVAKAPAKPGPTCPITPLKLTSLMSRTGQPLMQLNSDGTLTNPLFAMAPNPRQVKLDPRGCVVGNGEVWVERESAEQLWTQRQRFTVDGNKVHVGDHHFEFKGDGAIVDSRTDTADLYVEPVTPDSLCAAQMLFITFMSMMPSMAVSDGKPAMLDAPSPSVCQDVRDAYAKANP